MLRSIMKKKSTREIQFSVQHQVRHTGTSLSNQQIGREGSLILIVRKSNERRYAG